MFTFALNGSLPLASNDKWMMIFIIIIISFFNVNSFLLKWKCKPVTRCTRVVTASLMQHENQALHDQINYEYNAAVTLG